MALRRDRMGKGRTPRGRGLAALGLALGIVAILAARGAVMMTAGEPAALGRFNFLALAAPSLHLDVVTTSALALFGLVVVIAGIWRRRGWAVIIGAILLLGFGWRPIQLFAMRSMPQSLTASPKRFAAVPVGLTRQGRIVLITILGADGHEITAILRLRTPTALPTRPLHES